MNSRKKSSRKPLDNKSRAGLPERVAELERQVADLKKDVAMLEQSSAGPFVLDEFSQTEKKKKKPGPKERLSDTQLVHDRDALILWLEPFWPWLVGRLPARTAEELGAILEAIAGEPSARPGYQQRVLQNAAVLHDFLWSERFTKTLPKAAVSDALKLPRYDERRWRAANRFPTRQIANAMAGVPDLAWRTSLDRCSARPSATFISLIMDMHYRDLFGIPAPKDRDLTGYACPVPKPLRPVLARIGDQVQKGVEPAPEAKGLGNEGK